MLLLIWRLVGLKLKLKKDYAEPKGYSSSGENKDFISPFLSVISQIPCLDEQNKWLKIISLFSIKIKESYTEPLW